MTKVNHNLRPHIGIFGRCNTGKSSIINAFLGQNLSIVADTPGTTTDPVKKTMEIPGLGPAVMIDTAGIDDVGELGCQRVEKSVQTIKQVDLAILVLSDNYFGGDEAALIEKFRKYHVPFIFLHNKSDLTPINHVLAGELMERYSADLLEFSAKKPENIEALTLLMVKNIPETVWHKAPLFGDLVKPGDLVLLVTPVDSEAPEGRLILPQVQAIREALDNNCIAVVLKETEVLAFLERSTMVPALVITDSQLFGQIDKIIPQSMPLTSFSIILARQKGDFDAYLKGTPKIKDLKDGDRILILESCTHHSSCDDIGRVKIPGWLKEFTGKNLEFDIISGLTEPSRPFTDYTLVLQCGGCMITQKQIQGRLLPAIEAGIPVTNYGMAIAYVKGTWDRAVGIFG